jgi:hypothetical protein
VAKYYTRMIALKLRVPLIAASTQPDLEVRCELVVNLTQGANTNFQGCNRVECGPARTNGLIEQRMRVRSMAFVLVKPPRVRKPPRTSAGREDTRFQSPCRLFGTDFSGRREAIPRC